MDTLPLIGDVHEYIVRFIDDARSFAVATVLKAAGSTPREEGARALLDPTGAIWGTIGGGPLEARTRQLAIEAIRSGRPVVFDLPFAGPSAEENLPICGGAMRVLIDPTPSAHRPAWQAAVEAHRQRRRGLLITTVQGTDPPTVHVRYLAADAVGSDERHTEMQLALALRTKRPVHSNPATAAEMLIEPVVPPDRLVIVGGGHVGQALARHAALLEFELVIVEDRPEFAQPAQFPDGTAIHCGDPAEILPRLHIDETTYVAIVSRGHPSDSRALAACIHAPARYIGMMGSRRKVALVRKMFIDSGQADAQTFERVHAPIGLDLGAETVPEIAGSIVAELIAVRRNADPSRRGRTKEQAG